METLTHPHIEVFYVDRSTGWAAAPFDGEGNQTTEAAFCFHKCDAIAEARVLAGDTLPIKIFTRFGQLQRTNTESKTCRQ